MSAYHMATFKRGATEFELDAAQITTSALRRIFQVDPTQVFLRREIDGYVYIPDDSGNFNLSSQEGIAFSTIMVEGSTQITSGPFGAGSSGSVTLSSTSRGSTSQIPPVFRSVVAARKSPNSFNLKIVLSKMHKGPSGKSHFDAISQTYMEITEKNARVSDIKDYVQRCWEDQGDLAIVTSDGLCLEDCDGTRGLQFWKNPRRKIYAVKAADCTSSNKGKGKHKRSSMSRMLLSDESDEEFEEPHLKKAMEFIIAPIKEDMNDVKRTIQELIHIDNMSKIPLGLKKMLSETFQCKTCCGIIHPPVILTKCCKTIVSCERCVNSWFSGDDALVKSCPVCRADRGYNETMVLRGLDDFLKAWEKAACESINSSDDESQ